MTRPQTRPETRPQTRPETRPRLDLSALAVPGLALLRAELLALEQLLPGHMSEDFDARCAAEQDNLPV